MIKRIGKYAMMLKNVEKMSGYQIKKHTNINLGCNKNNEIILIARLWDMLEIQRISLFTETGNMIECLNKDEAKDTYVISTILQAEEALRALDTHVTVNDTNVARKYLRNQVVALDRKYHYETTGTIHGFDF